MHAKLLYTLNELHTYLQLLVLCLYNSKITLEALRGQSGPSHVVWVPPDTIPANMAAQPPSLMPRNARATRPAMPWRHGILV
jgi:hypothetical protein